MTADRVAEQLSQRLRGALPKATPAAAPMQQPAPHQPAPMPAPAAAAPQPAAPPTRPAQPAMPARPAPQPAPVYSDLDPGYGLEPAEIEEAEAPDAPFMPPLPEAPARMPRVEDFPPVAQRQMEAHRRAPQAQPQQHDDRGPMSLLRRLASVGLGRREEAPVEHTRQPPPVQRPAVRQAQPQQRQLPPQPRAAVPGARAQGKIEQPPYRAQQGDLDPHGRSVPAQRPLDDELEIPAFLRRQAN
jgi:cell division protein FtsZ